jgi:DNA-binding CsgD family transcriptional regulator
MFPEKLPEPAAAELKTYPLGEKTEPSAGPTPFIPAIIALSHTNLEQRLYSAMLIASTDGTNGHHFTARQLMEITGLRSLSTIRRGLEGLMVKLSIERNGRNNENGKREAASVYRCFSPSEIIDRRKENKANGGQPFALTLEFGPVEGAYERAMGRVAENAALSRREAQVALCCVVGLSNAEIGNRLRVSEQTVKFHLRSVFIKFGVKRRTELISKLLM